MLYNKNRVQVVIDGKTVNLMGDESEEYIKSIADYINSKMSEIKNSEHGGSLSAGMLSVLLSINIADDYFKAEDRAVRFEKELDIIKKSMKKNEFPSDKDLDEVKKLIEDNQRLKNKLSLSENELKLVKAKNELLQKEENKPMQMNVDSSLNYNPSDCEIDVNNGIKTDNDNKKHTSDTSKHTKKKRRKQ